MTTENSIAACNLELERSVLGACLLDNTYFPLVDSRLGDGDLWYLERHRDLFVRARDVWRERGRVDMVAMADEGLRYGQPGRFGGDAELALIMQQAAFGPAVAEYVERLVEHGRRRRLQGLSARIASALGKGEDSLALAQMVQAEVDALHVQGREPLVRGEAVASRYWEGLAARAQGRKLGLGYEAVDVHVTEGLLPGRITLFAARPRTGKSAFVAGVVRNLAAIGVPSLWLTYEMSLTAQMDRLVSMETGIPLTRVLELRLDEHEKDRVEEAVGRIARWPLVFDDRRGVRWVDAVAAATRARRKHGVEVVFVDLFDRLADLAAEDNKAGAIEDLLNRCSDQALRLGVHFFLVAQVNRRADQRDDHRPRLSDLRNSGAYEQNADLVLLLHRERLLSRLPVDGKPDVCEVEIAKQRNGPQATAYLDYLGETVTFAPCTRKSGDAVSAPRRNGKNPGLEADDMLSDPEPWAERGVGD